MGTDLIGQFMKWMQGGGAQAQTADINKISTMRDLMPEYSLLNPQALAGANELGGNLNGLASGYEPSFMDKMTGGTRPDGSKFNGWGGLALGAGQGILGGWMGMKQLDHAKEQLGESKRQFNQNFEANRKTTNTALEDRQKARVASNAGAYESVGSYMKKNEV